MSPWAGKKVFITGGSSGIGERIASDFLAGGANVTILANDAEKLEIARSKLAQISPHVSSTLCDLADLDQVRKAATDFIARIGPPDILINNAGYAVYETFDQMTSDEVVRLLTVNFVSACVLTREFLPSMIERRSGDIVMMASIAGRVPLTPCGAYSAAKHGLVAWAQTLRAELHRYHIKVHAICPGRVETDFFLHPSFARRGPRREAKWTISLESVSRATLDITGSDRFLVCVPRSLALLSWLKNLVPIVSDPLLQLLMRSRVESVATEGRS